MVNENLKEGTIVWVITSSVGVDKCKTVELRTCKNDVESFNYYELNSLDHRWHYGAKLENIFLTEDEAKKELQKREQKDYQEKYDSIKSMEDLLNFMYVRMFSEEYSDWEGIKAAEDKAKEFGYNLKK